MGGSKRPPLDEDLALFRATIAAEGITTSAGTIAGDNFIDASLKGAGDNSFISMLAVLYPGDPQNVDSKDITDFDDTNGRITLAGAYKGIGAAIPAGVPYKIITFRFTPAEVAAIEAKLDHATHGLAALKALIDAIKAVTDVIPDAGALTALLADITAILADTGELQTDWHDGGRLDLLIDAIKAVTDNLPDAGALTALLASIASILEDTETTLPATLTAIVNYLDSEIADILADTGELQTDWADGGRLDLLIDGIKAVTDALPDAGALTALLADITAIKAETDKIAGKMLFTMDFWSALGGEAVVTGAKTPVTVGLNNVVVEDLPDGAIIVRAVAMMKFRMIENLDTENANKLDATAALPMQLDDVDNHGMRDCINFVDDAFALAASGREGGDVIVGDINIADMVDGNDTYDFQWLDAKADYDSLQFNDVQMGIRIWYKV